jgi:MOSC domain-containing protein YiiM
MHIISINLGQPETLTYFYKPVETGGRKTPAPHALLRRTNFEGDGQADLKNHGGPDKAVCVYSFDHYPYWEQTLGVRLEPGAFSENLTIAGLRESEVCIGDVFDIGEARVQISQPRIPCSKLAGKHNRKDLPDRIHANGYSGFYFRVLREGLVRVGEAVTLVERHPSGASVEFANQVMYKQRTDRASLERLLAVEALSEAWRASLSKRL